MKSSVEMSEIIFSSEIQEDSGFENVIQQTSEESVGQVSPTRRIAEDQSRPRRFSSPHRNEKPPIVFTEANYQHVVKMSRINRDTPKIKSVYFNSSSHDRHWVCNFCCRVFKSPGGQVSAYKKFPIRTPR